MSHEPSQTQIDRCLLMGWIHIGDGFFAKDDYIGWFEQRNFIKAYAPGKQHTLNMENPPVLRAGSNDRALTGTLAPSSRSAP